MNATHTYVFVGNGQRREVRPSEAIRMTRDGEWRALAPYEVEAGSIVVHEYEAEPISAAERQAKAEAQASASGWVLRECANCGTDLIVFDNAAFTRHTVNDSTRCPGQSTTARIA